MGEERKEMTPEEINRKIAEAMGFTFITQADGELVILRNGVEFWSDPPDFRNDLNACAEMRRTLGVTETIEFVKQLSAILARDQKAGTVSEITRSTDRNAVSYRIAIFISAESQQQCEAFLRTKGLWVERPSPLPPRKNDENFNQMKGER